MIESARISIYIPKDFQEKYYEEFLMIIEDSKEINKFKDYYSKNMGKQYAIKNINEAASLVIRALIMSTVEAHRKKIYAKQVDTEENLDGNNK